MKAKAKARRKPPKTDPNGLDARLREIVRNRGLTASELGREAEIDPGMVQRFLTGQRDIRLRTASKIAGALGLRLVEGGRGKARATEAGDTTVPN